MTQTVLLEDITTYLARGSAPKYTDKDEFYVLNQKCVRDWRISYEQARFTDAHLKKVSSDRILQNGDILVNSTGQGTLGRVGQFIGADRPTTVDSHVTIVRANTNIVDSIFLGYVLKGREREIEDLAEGSTGQTELSRFKLAALRVTLPGFETQKKIADILGTIDEKIELNRQMNETLEQMGQALFRHYFIDNPEAEKWGDGVVADLITIYSGYAFKRNDFDPDGDYGLVTIKNVQDGNFVPECSDHLSSIPVKTPDYAFLKTGDILLSLTGNVGRVCIVHGENLLLNQRVAKLVGADDKQSFAYFMFRQEEFKNRLISMSRGTAQLNLSPIETKKIKLKLPPKEIFSQYHEQAEPLFEAITANYTEIQNLTTLRDTLLPRLINGKVKV